MILDSASSADILSVAASTTDGLLRESSRTEPQEPQPLAQPRPVSLQLPLGLSCFILAVAGSGYIAGLRHASVWLQLAVWISALGSCALLLAVNQTNPGALPCGTVTGTVLCLLLAISLCKALILSFSIIHRLI